MNEGQEPKRDLNWWEHYFQNQEEAKERAIQRAQAMLNTVEVWRGKTCLN